jgi:hypothetical protein
VLSTPLLSTRAVLSDYCTNCSHAAEGVTSGLVGGFQNELFIEQIAEYMATHKHQISNKTLLELGFEYVRVQCPSFGRNIWEVFESPAIYMSTLVAPHCAIRSGGHP